MISTAREGTVDEEVVLLEEDHLPFVRETTTIEATGARKDRNRESKLFDEMETTSIGLVKRWRISDLLIQNQHL